MTRSFRFLLVRAALVLPLLFALHSPAHAQGGCVNGGSGGCVVPEIEPGLANGGLALLGGLVLVVRARRNGSRLK